MRRKRTFFTSNLGFPLAVFDDLAVGASTSIGVDIFDVATGRLEEIGKRKRLGTTIPNPVTHTVGYYIS